MSESQLELLSSARDLLQLELDSGAGFLEALRREGVLDRAAVHRVKNVRERSERNASVLSDLETSGHSRPYDVLLRALQASGQNALAARIMDPHMERQTLLQCQAVLASQSRRVATYLDAQAKRRKAKLETTTTTERPTTAEEENPWDPKDLAVIVESTKSAVIQMERSRLLIDKIFDVLSTSAKTSSTLNRDLRDLDKEVGMVLSKAPKERTDTVAELTQEEGHQEEGADPVADEPPKLKGKDEENITIVNRLKRNLGKVSQMARSAGDEYRRHCRELRRITEQIRTRRQNLARKVATKPKVEEAALRGSEKDPIEEQIDLLQEELNKYKETEVQATFHLSLHSMQRKLSQKWDDNLAAAEDAMKEMGNGKDNAKAQAAMRSTLEEVKAEREEASRLIEEMKRIVCGRKEVLSQAGHASPQVRRRNPGASRSGLPPNGRNGIRGPSPSSAERPEPTRIPSKLQLLQEELGEYVELETNSTYKFRTEVSRVKTSSERRSSDLNDTMEKSSDQLQAAEREKEKYRKLYEQEKLLKGQQMIKRDAEKIIKDLEKKAKEAESDRDRYKRLYEKSRISQGVKVTVKESFVRELEEKIRNLEVERERFKKMYETERMVKVRKAQPPQEKTVREISQETN